MTHVDRSIDFNVARGPMTSSGRTPFAHGGAMVIGFDPGVRAHGWSLIDVTIPTAPIWFAHGHTARFESVFDYLEASGLAQYVRLVAVERAPAVAFAEANVHAMATAWAGGMIFGFARARGYAVHSMTPNEWRHALVGSYKRGENIDAKVKAALLTFVRHYPRRSNVHQRDAGGVAVVAARDWRRLVVVSREASTPSGHRARGSRSARNPVKGNPTPTSARPQKLSPPPRPARTDSDVGASEATTGHETNGANGEG